MNLKQPTTKEAAWKKYWAVFTLALKDRAHNTQRLYAIVLVNSFRVIVMLVIYNYAFNYIGHPINGIDAQIAVWSIAVYFMLLSGQFRFIFNMINDEIQNGELDLKLSKPYNYLVYKFWERLGKGIISFGAMFLVLLPLLFILTGGFPSTISISRVFLGILLFILGNLVSAAIYILIVLPALWINDATPLFWITDKAVLILGGAYIPLALLPEVFRSVASLTPFGAPMFATQMFNPDFIAHAPFLLLMQVFWLVVLGFAIYWTFKVARKNLSINGG